VRLPRKAMAVAGKSGGASSSNSNNPSLGLVQSLADEAKEDAHKWKEYEEPHNVFDDDEEYKAPEWRAYEAPHNVFDDMDAEESPKWKPMEPEENALADMPDAYPFDETKDGHEWKKWDEGKSASDMIKEHNVFDDGTTTEMTYQLGEHSTGKPFKEYKPDKNVYDKLVEKDVKDGQSDHEWHEHKPEKNVFDNGYEFPKGR